MPHFRWKDAAKECSAILEAAPNQAAALKTRAKAYEQQGLFKQALSDVQVGRTRGQGCFGRSMHAGGADKGVNSAFFGRWAGNPQRAPASPARRGGGGAVLPLLHSTASRSGMHCMLCMHVARTCKCMLN